MTSSVTKQDELARDLALIRETLQYYFARDLDAVPDRRLRAREAMARLTADTAEWQATAEEVGDELRRSNDLREAAESRLAELHDGLRRIEAKAGDQMWQHLANEQIAVLARALLASSGDHGQSS
jgi:hypothetical protein